MGKKSFGRGLADNEAMAYAKHLRTSPQKLNLVAETIRGKKCEAALSELEFSHRRISGEVKKLLESAIANAENNHQLDVDRLYVAEATVGKTMVIKRWRARARGRVGRIQKPFSNLRLVVREREETA
ncbi:MAG: 50S ribosomal protein L22 [Alphaproteobacteria bacterium MarineAlpha3_Bin3]|jgi:large subunit ribosomal protein L22|nr:MAG: 50S ribosomal protein L22 [Alphaproteobacteria bacterium MarineAlpha3_Bin3]